MFRSLATPGDGNCFYHAVADQLRFLSLKRFTAQELREQMSCRLRDQPILKVMYWPVFLPVTTAGLVDAWLGAREYSYSELSQ
jgi:hypothetical protein